LVQGPLPGAQGVLQPVLSSGPPAGPLGGPAGGQLVLQPLKGPEAGGVVAPSGPGGVAVFPPPGAVRPQAAAVTVGGEGLQLASGLQVVQAQHMMGPPQGMQLLLPPAVQLLAPGPGPPQALQQQQQQPGGPGHQGGAGRGGQGGEGGGRGGGPRPMTRKAGGGGAAGQGRGKRESPRKQRGGLGGGRRGGDGKGKRGGRQG
jgi:hypothetical protein